MKIKYTILISLAYTILCSSASLASGGEVKIDVSDEKPPLKGSRGMKPKVDLKLLPRQKTVLPPNMIPEHRPRPKIRQNTQTPVISKRKNCLLSLFCGGLCH